MSREPAKLAEAFEHWGKFDAPSVGSPLYAELGFGAACDPELLRLAAETRPNQPAPNMLFAAVQYNDPDALYWGAIYGIAAVWTGIAALRPALFSKSAVSTLFLVSLVLALAGVWYHWPQSPEFWKQDVWWNTETAREGMGMMIAAFALLFAGFIALRARRA